jgi:ABC-type lipoprotein release transport system permease subunit
MSDPSTLWLTITNIALGVVVLICCGAVAIGVIQEIAAKRKKSTAMSQIDREVSDLVASYQDGHTFHLPELGITMADGGEELPKKEEK